MKIEIAEFITFSEKLDKIKSLDIISFKKLYNKKLNTFLLIGSEQAKDEILNLQKSFYDFFCSTDKQFNG